MSGARQCGVTLQTLDETKFDNGTILAQTKALPLPLDNRCTYSDLLNYLTPIAASLLVNGITDRVFIPPLFDAGWLKQIPPTEKTEKAKLTKIIHAPKITSYDKCINWREESAIPIERRYRALGRLWSEVMVDPKTKKRIVFEDMEVVDTPEEITSLLKMLKTAQKEQAGLIQVNLEGRGAIRFMVPCQNTEKYDLKPRFFVCDGDAIIVACQNGALRIKRITVEGEAKQHASKVFQAVQEWELWNIRMDNLRLIVKAKSDGVDFEVDSKEEKAEEERN